MTDRLTLRCILAVMTSLLVTVLINFLIDTAIQRQLERQTEEAAFELLDKLESVDLESWPAVMAAFESRYVSQLNLDLTPQTEHKVSEAESTTLSAWTGDGESIYLDYDEASVLSVLELVQTIEGTGWDLVVQASYEHWFFPDRVMTGLSLMLLLFAAISWSLRPVFIQRQRLREQLTKASQASLSHEALSVDIYSQLNSLVSEAISLKKNEHQMQEQWRDLLHAIAHELRSPLSRINFAISELVSSESQEEKQKLEAAIDCATDEINAMVSEVLQYSRLELEVSQTLFETIDLLELVSGLCPRLQQTYPDVDFQIERENVVVQANAKQLERALINLMRNAARYCQSVVRVQWHTNETALHLSIEDDGPGVAPGKRERIFEPFTRLDPSRSRDSGGVGLGLAIVKAVVNNHGATISVHDAELGGARFLLTLPLKHEDL